MTHFSFEYRIVGKDEWKPKARIWKTWIGAIGAAEKWKADMAAENCPVNVRVGRVENNHFIPLNKEGW